MKYLFLILLAVLIGASAITALTLPDARSQVPVIYWVTDANPARQEQIRLFQQWMKKHNYPPVELRLDTANNDTSKKVVQGVSGVGGDCMDIGSGGGMRYFQSIGLLTDCTKWAKELGFGPEHTSAAMKTEITLDGKQYMFPCNCYVHLYWVNKATFRKYGLPPPPPTWDLATFERIGKAFVAAANPPGKRREFFFANSAPLDVVRRSDGVAVFNETLTRCTLDDPRNVRALKLIRKWTYDDHLCPTAAEVNSFSTASGYGGSTLQLFNSGNYAMFMMGRYALIQLRKFGKLELAVSYPPITAGGMPNASCGTRAAGIYTASPHPELAKYFLAYLASEDYNMQIVRDADSQPPNPIYTKTREYTHPPDWPNEWGTHEVWAKAMDEIAVGPEYSPYVVPDAVGRLDGQATEAYMSGVVTAEAAAKQAADRINAEIARTLEETPSLQAGYDKLLARQKQIDELKARGEKIPLAWVDNHYLRRYYEFKALGK